MKTLGVKEVFPTGVAFDKITAGGPIGVGKILHKAVVKVTKDGNEGSVATRVELTLFSAGFQKQKLVDRPSFHLHYPGPSQQHPCPGWVAIQDP